MKLRLVDLIKFEINVMNNINVSLTVNTLFCTLFLICLQLYTSSDLHSSLSLGPLEQRVLRLLSLTIRNAALLFINCQVSLPPRSGVCEVLE